MRRALLSVVCAGAIAGVLASAASAALWLKFSQTRAAPGTAVTVRTTGSGALANIPRRSPPLRVFLVRADDVGVNAPDDDRLIPLGELTVDAKGNGELRFTVPNVPSGDYVTLTHCVPCGPFSGGRDLLPTGPDKPFVVLERSPSGDGFPVLPAAVGVAGVLFLAAASLSIARLRSRRG